MAYKQKKTKKIMMKPKKKKFPIYALEDPEGWGMTEQDVINLWQEGVDSGIVWRLQGWYGRQAQAMLDEGILKYPRQHKAESSTDYYGNPIPTHAQAKKHGIYKERKKRAQMQRQLQEAFD